MLYTTALVRASSGLRSSIDGLLRASLDMQSAHLDDQSYELVEIAAYLEEVRVYAVQLLSQSTQAPAPKHSKNRVVRVFH